MSMASPTRAGAAAGSAASSGGTSAASSTCRRCAAVSESGGISIEPGPSARAWQARRIPAARSSAVSRCRSCSVGGARRPCAGRTRHPPQVPSPAQIAWSSTPADRAASRIVSPARTATRRPIGSNVRTPAEPRKRSGAAGMEGSEPALRARRTGVADAAAPLGCAPEAEDERDRLARRHPAAREERHAGGALAEEGKDLPLSLRETEAVHTGTDRTGHPGARARRPLAEMAGRAADEGLDGRGSEGVERERICEIAAEHPRDAALQLLAERGQEDRRLDGIGEPRGDQGAREAAPVLQRDAERVPFADPEDAAGDARAEEHRAFPGGPLGRGEEAGAALADA